MARILPKNLVSEFVEAYNVTDLSGDCSMDQLTVKIWDKYGTTPNEGAETATGKFVAAIVICDDCSKGVELDRAKLEAVEK
jgi:hypothetical protein